jgi:hypothetical protein
VLKATTQRSFVLDIPNGMWGGGYSYTPLNGQDLYAYHTSNYHVKYIIKVQKMATKWTERERNNLANQAGYSILSPEGVLQPHNTITTWTQMAETIKYN